MSGIGKIKLVALDSNIFIYNLEQNPDFVKFSDKVFQKLASNKLKAVTSIITLTEILSYPNTERVINQLRDDFKSTPNLSIFEVNEEIALEAANIRREYRFRLPDSIQLATAKQAKAKAFITNDERLKKFKELKVILISEV